MNIAAEWAKYYTLSGCRQSLLDGGWAINAINQGLDSMDVLLRDQKRHRGRRGTAPPGEGER